MILIKQNLVLSKIMSEKGSKKSINEMNEEKILFGTNTIVCFACGEQVEKDTEICPYCKTNIR